ncbi:MAG: 1-acyl-sn-glycerol-3-phosphate acyltransferase [Betaproteobacteria bacterium HGW-Betaproteobacteria-10]|jgi:1-acyl-sn-glycerol-3-phosphate acyltransferase|nr:MAG: 1-acyl-sn-glycerol-3-phosphate acyltransferase [Betaproteobacteria bacterium HGW-Betaproteobacteria-10]
MTEPARRESPLRIAQQYVAMLFIVGLFFLLCLSWLPFALLFLAVLPRRLGQRWGRYMIHLGFRTYLDLLALFLPCRFDLSELDQLSAEGALIIAANHPSLLDAVLIVSRLPNTVCVMKAALMNNVFFGAAARLAAYIRNDEPLAIILNSRQALQEGAQLLIFPEGTRSENFPLDRCTASTGLIAWRSRIPVQTLLIDYSTPYLSKAWGLRPPELPLQCRIRLGRCFSPERDVAAFTAELEAYFRAELGEKSPSTAACVI